MDISSSLWCEKYRPKKLEDLVIPDNFRSFFGSCIQKKEISNFLLVGPPGSGKSTLARILVSKYGIMTKPRDNVLEANGSAKSTRGISFVENVIEPFLKVPPAGIDKQKIVFIDECDHLTEESFHSQRSIIEEYSRYGRFLYTANYISMIPDPLQSRLQIFTFRQIPTQFIIEYCQNILLKENITFDSKDLIYVINGLYPDVRRIVNTLQSNCIDNKLKINTNVILTNEKVLIASFVEIISAFKNKESQKLSKLIEKSIQLLDEPNIDFRNLYTQLFSRNEVPANIKIIINKYSNSHNQCLIPSMHFAAMIFESIKCLEEYQRLRG